MAGKQNEQLTDESRSIYSEYYNKILLYSAGAFSFNTTLIGLVLSNKPKILAKVGIFVPNIYWMYLSMCLFLLAGAAVLVAKRLDAQYTGSFGMRNYLDKLKIKELTMKKMMGKFGDKFIITKDGTPKQEIAIANSNIPKITNAFIKNKSSEDFANKTMRVTKLLSEVFVLIATIALFIFVIQISQGIVWG